MVRKPYVFEGAGVIAIPEGKGLGLGWAEPEVSVLQAAKYECPDEFFTPWRPVWAPAEGLVCWRGPKA